MPASHASAPLIALGQRIAVYTLLVTELVLIVSAFQPGGSSAAIGLAILIGAMPSIVLLAEFLLMRWINQRDITSRPTWWQIGGAWLHECWLMPLIFGWRQPFRSDRWPNVDGNHRSSVRGVVLVHGYACNRGVWNEWLKRLSTLKVPAVAVNLEPPWASIEAYASAIEEAVLRIERVTGRSPVLVAHSMGGLAARCWWQAPANASRLQHLITLGSPHHGTWLARWGVGRNVRQMQMGHEWLQRLLDQETPDRRGRTTCFYSHCDNVVFPATSATLPGADNRHLEATAHLHLIDHAATWAALLDRLDPPVTEQKPVATDRR